MPSHSIPHVAACTAALVLHVSAYTIYMIFARKSTVEWGLLNRTEPSIFKLYNTDFAPDGWGSIVWKVILPFHFYWLCSSLFQLRKPKHDCDYPYKLNSILLYVFFGLGSTLQIARVLLFGWEHFLASFFMALLSGVLLIAALVKQTPDSAKCCKQGGYDAVSISNAVNSNLTAIYAVWAVYYALANLSLVLVYRSPIQASSQDAATGCLSVVLILIVVNIGLDFTVLERYNRYQLGSYFAEALAMGCVLSNHNKQGFRNRNTILTIIILTLSLVCLFAKIINCCAREYLRYQDRDHQVDSNSEVPKEKRTAYCIYNA